MLWTYPEIWLAEPYSDALAIQLPSSSLLEAVVYTIVPILYSVALIYSIWSPNREYFEITDGVINVKKGKRKRQIKIPKELSTGD